MKKKEKLKECITLESINKTSINEFKSLNVLINRSYNPMPQNELNGGDNTGCSECTPTLLPNSGWQDYREHHYNDNGSYNGFLIGTI